jgi:predicted Zn-dependent protease
MEVLMPARLRHAAVALLLTTAVACATNPATGRRQLSLVGEGQEIEMGREAAEQVRTMLGLYTDPGLQSYVNNIGQKLAAASERPKLDWSFQVVDDAAVNAFALPGGYIYVTRGLLTHVNSEAELAAVLGHEIGHVTARHSVNQMSKAQLASVGLGLGMILKPELRSLGQVGELGLGLLLLKHGRDDENESDELGIRYMTRAGYPGTEMPKVLQMLQRVSEAENVGRVPNWLSTHPNPADRVTRVSAQLRTVRGDGGSARREPYLRQIDGIAFGPNPREGFFRSNVFYHPDMAFRVEFPRGFRTQNQKQAVGAISPNEDAVVVVSLTGRGSPEAAAREFFAQQGVQMGREWRGGPRGLDAVGHEFAAVSGQTPIRGLATFVEHDGRVYQLLGYTTSSGWSRYDNVLADSLASFERLTDRRLLGVQPLRLKIVPASPLTSADDLARRAPVDRTTLLLINGAGVESTATSGFVKTVVGDDLAAEIYREQKKDSRQ